MMSFDSIVQLTQARSGAFSDWHPPVMSWIWRQLDRAYPGPLGMVLIQNLMFWAGLVLVARLSIRPWALALFVALAVGLGPPFFPLLGVVWKDTAMGAALLLVFGLFLLGQNTNGRWPLLFGWLFLLYAACLRHNTLPAVLPLALWGGALVQATYFPTRGRVLGFGIGLTGIVFAILLNSATTSLLVQRREYPVQQVLSHDLAAISVARGENVMPQALQHSGTPLTLGELKSAYSPRNVVVLYAKVSMLRSAPDIEQLIHAWLRTVPENARAYLRHRWHAFRIQMAIDETNVCYPYAGGVDANSLGVPTHEPFVRHRVLSWLQPLQDSLFFRGWFYLSSLVGLLAFARWRWGKVQPEHWALGLSGLLYGLAYFFLSTTCDFRLHWWTAVSTAALALLVLRPPLEPTPNTK
jgi:hypothetical protein